MSEIKIQIAKELVGKAPYMGLLFIDSYGDKLLKELSLEDINPHDPDCIRLDNYFTPCSHCGLPVVDSSIMPDTQGICDHCYKAGPNTTTQEDIMTHELHIENAKQGFETPEERIKAAVYMASDRFWATVADLFPECTSGDLDPLVVHNMEETMLSTVTCWVNTNKPAVNVESFAVELDLHYKEEWQLYPAAANHVNACTTNVAVSGESLYISVNKKTVDICDASDNTLHTWTVGDNPTVLMNYLEERFGNQVLYDNNKLFDDIITIAKSNHVK